MKKRVLLTSVVTIILCLCLIAGSTYALFTDRISVNVAVTSATVDVEAAIDGTALKTWSLEDKTHTEANNRGGAFSNGGKASLVGGVLQIERMTPGDVVQFPIDITNKSNVAIAYKITASAGAYTDENGKVWDGLLPALIVTVNGVQQDMNTYSSGWIEIPAGQTIEDLLVEVTFPNKDTDGSHDNQFQGKGVQITFTVVAVQGNGVENGQLITTP